MKFAVFSLVVHKEVDGKLYGYAPYIREMDIWTKYADRVFVVGHHSKSTELDPMDLAYEHPNVRLVSVPTFHTKTLFQLVRTLVLAPFMMLKMAGVMMKCDHLHFRCPSNVSALAAVVQVVFPSKPKVTKYAGNWDPNSDQPRGYRFQKWLLSNTFLTKKMKILVYGEWTDQSRYVQPFMSATYFENEKIKYYKRDYSKKLEFVFTGSLVVGKRPLLAIQIIERLIAQGFDCELHMFGEGNLRSQLTEYISKNDLSWVILHGNQSKAIIMNKLKIAHFAILPSKSEGWPKAIAEGMFFGAIPISTRISCLPWMFDQGKRGILIEADAEQAANKIMSVLTGSDLDEMSYKALMWSQHYTVDRLESEIKTIMKA